MAEIRFVPASDKIAADDATLIGRELLRIAKRHDDALTPELIVTEATPPGATLHRYFEWNDHKAAGEYRILQARRMVQSINIEIVDASGAVSQVRGFVNVPIREIVDDGGIGLDEAKPAAVKRRAYVPITVARSNEQMWRDVLDEAEARLFSWQMRYQKLLEYEEASRRLAGVMREIETLKEVAD